MNFAHLCLGPFPLASRRGIVPVSRLGIVPSVLPPASVAGLLLLAVPQVLPCRSSRRPSRWPLAADPTTPSSRRNFELWCQPQRASHFVVPSLFGSQRRWVPAPQLDAAKCLRGLLGAQVFDRKYCHPAQKHLGGTYTAWVNDTKYLRSVPRQTHDSSWSAKPALDQSFNVFFAIFETHYSPYSDEQKR